MWLILLIVGALLWALGNTPKVKQLGRIMTLVAVGLVVLGTILQAIYGY